MINAVVVGKVYDAVTVLELQPASQQGGPTPPATLWRFESVLVASITRDFSSPSSQAWTLQLVFDGVKYYAFQDGVAHNPRACYSSATGQPCTNLQTAR